MTTTTMCTSCSAGPQGEAGHGALEYYVAGPYPGQHIFKCSGCRERWIRHYGSPAERFAWSRYSQQFSTRTPRADPSPRVAAA
jgi:hypothetical protein